MKTANKTLIASIVAIVICLSIIVGATYAWFTDEAGSGNITVSSGKVNIEASIDESSLQLWSLVDGVQTKLDKSTFETGGTAGVGEDGSLELVNVVPGDKVQLTINVTNNSNVSIRYRVKLGTKEGGLADVLETKVVGEPALNKWSSVITPDVKSFSVNVSVELPEDVGNDYQGTDENPQTTTVAFIVEAIQSNADVMDGVTVTSPGELSDAAKQDGVRIVLEDSIELENGAFTFEKTGILDLNGNTLSNATGASTITVGQNAELTIIDSSDSQLGAIVNDDKNGNAIVVEQGGQLTVKAGTVSNDSKTPTIVVKDQGVVVIDGGKITGNAENVTIEQDGVKKTIYQGTVTVEQGGSVVINGGTIDNTAKGSALLVKADGEAVIEDGEFIRYGNGKSDGNHYVIENYGTMTINSGTFRHDDAYAPSGTADATITLVANKVGGIMTINGGNFSGMMICIKNESETDLKISGGTFDAKDGEGSNYGQSLQNHGTAVITGGTFLKYIIHSKSGATSPRTEISGGEFYKTFLANQLTSGKVVISGGRYHQEAPAYNYVDSGYVADPTPDANGTFGVKLGTAKLNLDSRYFESFADVMEYVKAATKKTVYSLKLLANMTESLVIPADYNFDFDMSTYTLSNTEGEHTITVYGTVVIRGGSTTKTTTLTNTSSNKAVVYVAQGGTATVQRSIHVERDANYYVILNDGTLVVGNAGSTPTNATYHAKFVVQHTDSTSANIICNNNTMTVYGGTLNGNIVSENNAQAIIDGGTFNGDVTFKGKVTIYNGGNTDGTIHIPTFNGSVSFSDNDEDTIIHGGFFAKKPNVTIAQDCSVVDNDDGSCNVYWGGMVVLAYKVSSSTLVKYFNSIADAVAFIQDNALSDSLAIGLCGNTSENITIPNGLSIKLCLNGFTLSNSTEDGDTVTVSEGSTLSFGSAGTIENKGTGSAIKAENAKSISISYDVTINGKVDISCTTVSITKGTFNEEVTITASGTVTVSGGTFNEKVTITGATINIKGGKFKAGESDNPPENITPSAGYTWSEKDSDGYYTVVKG
ncbi:MAG: hypothetical protein J1G02_02935 [Clostridiales bacterium]|nr:hypothetical protein [Clostridiales bacterium]